MYDFVEGLSPNLEKNYLGELKKKYAERDQFVVPILQKV